MFEPNEAYHTVGVELAPAGASAADAGIATRRGALRRDRRACAGRTAELGATRVARIFLRNGFLARSSSHVTDFWRQMTFGCQIPTSRPARTGCKRARAKYIDASFLCIIGITAR
jgi:hypothetical protein